MIKVFVLVGIIGGLAIAYVSIFALGPTSQLAPSESLLVGFRADGYLPASLNLNEDEAVEHEIFEVPPEDEVRLEAAITAAAANMDMDMSAGEAGAGMDMSAGEAGAEMDMSAGEAGAGMDMSGGGADGDMANGEANAMDMGDANAMEPEMGDGGLMIADAGAFDREIELKMTEWGFSEMNIEVVKGERIRFNVANDGQILHEFMVMEMTAMQAVSYRVERADWSLLEHEALYEKSLVLPGGEFSFVVEIQADGVWMFMCMLPFHMQMGMMGQMATANMAMAMDM
ncbi:MAG: multicopper oxidase domain-containing protein [Alphaproteobacteria bacterium]|nr:multicopper oxidase domain-containing protein [Alphaproteobacteria bacterium]